MDLRENISFLLREELAKQELKTPVRRPKLSIFFGGIRGKKKDLSSVFAYIEYVDNDGKPYLSGFEVKKFFTVTAGLQEFEALVEDLGVQISFEEEEECGYICKSFCLSS